MVVGGVVAATSRGRVHWMLASVLALWFSLGGHWVELWFLNWLRPRIPDEWGWRAAVRLAVWFAGGTILTIGMRATALALTGTAFWPLWWSGGILFIGVELVVHLVLQLRGRPSFYNGRE